MKTQRIKPKRSAKPLQSQHPINQRLRKARAKITRDSPGLLGYILRMGYDDDYEPQQEAEPTEHAPGSIEKVDVLTRRIELGQDLWHANDEKLSATIEQSNEMRKAFSRLMR